MRGRPHQGCRAGGELARSQPPPVRRQRRHHGTRRILTAGSTRQPFGLRPLSPTARRGSDRGAAIMARAPAAPASAVRAFGRSLEPRRPSSVARWPCSFGRQALAQWSVPCRPTHRIAAAQAPATHCLRVPLVPDGARMSDWDVSPRRRGGPQADVPARSRWLAWEEDGGRPDVFQPSTTNPVAGGSEHRYVFPKKTPVRLRVTKREFKPCMLNP